MERPVRILFLVLLASVCIVAALGARRRHAVVERRYGNFSANEILNRSSSLADVFSPASEDLQMAPYPGRTAVAGRFRPVWCVDYVREGISGEEEEGRCIWSGETGEPVCLTRRTPEESDAPSGWTYHSDYAVLAARRFLSRLAAWTVHSDWHLSREPRRDHHAWWVTWVSEDAEAVVQVSGSSGEVRYLRINHPLCRVAAGPAT